MLSRSMMDLRNGNKRWLAIVLLSGVAIVGVALGALLVLFVVHSNRGDQISGPIAKKIQSDLETESGNISPPSDDVSLRHSALLGLVKTY